MLCINTTLVVLCINLLFVHKVHRSATLRASTNKSLNINSIIKLPSLRPCLCNIIFVTSELVISLNYSYDALHSFVTCFPSYLTTVWFFNDPLPASDMSIHVRRSVVAFKFITITIHNVEQQYRYMQILGRAESCPTDSELCNELANQFCYS